MYLLLLPFYILIIVSGNVYQCGVGGGGGGGGGGIYIYIYILEVILAVNLKLYCQ